ncbi:zinc finger protein CONSTANS-LIKE 13 [Andrographis paniculata]|uniref:zinc finger protein CONSTANS-LIKE 13 n=1 Tax=Andrographis paniculata TaxID=175694 RepID=UPI0021E87832|nr:zinc finger protein CONSTANS-LIKE 13 [Andrographis paniculata]
MSVPDLENLPPSGEQTDRCCDFCNEPKALLYCRADSAKLCLNCDREVHSTNQLFKKHSRALLCDSCNSAPSTIFCRTDSVVLCQNCDWETHKNFGAVHDRRPIEGFNGCPSVAEMLNFLGLEDLGKKSLVVVDEGNAEGLMNLLVWETPSVVSLDDLISSNDSVDSGGHSFQAMGVPPLPKNRNAVCGKHKQEILFQLREMAKKEPNFSGSLEGIEFQPQLPEKCELRDSSHGYGNNTEPMSMPSYEDGDLKWYDFTSGVQDEGFPSTFVDSLLETNHVVPDKDSDACEGAGSFQELHPDVLVDSKPFQPLPSTGLRELNSQERDHAITRYKEKKKTRRYDKHIRYESRKIRAESRTRIKGRFAKMNANRM